MRIHTSHVPTFRAAFEDGLRIDKRLSQEVLQVSVAGPRRADGRFLSRVEYVPFPVDRVRWFEVELQLEELVEELWSWWVTEIVDLEQARAAGPFVRW